MRLFFSFIGVLFYISIQANSVTVDSTRTFLNAKVAPFSSVQPGDTIFLKAGKWQRLAINGFKGSEQKPIIIINLNGKVQFSNDTGDYCLSIQNCAYIQLSGTGIKNLPYGMSFNCPKGVGLGIGFGSTDYEIDHVEIGYTNGPGILAKTEPKCGGEYNRGNFIQYNTRIHDCYIHHTGTEGIYLGSTFYTGFHTNCNGRDTVLYPHVLDGVEVYNNIVSFSGWDGIQVASALNVKVHDNQVSGDSQKKVNWQMNGIIIGNGCSGSVYNNSIVNGEGTGIICFSLGDIAIYNNMIINPGSNNTAEGSKYGIYIDDRDAQPSNMVSLLHNLIVNPRAEGIRFISNEPNANHRIINNVIINPGDYPSSGGTSYINAIGDANYRIKVINNSTSLNIDSFQFVQPAINDYRLKPSSPLIDKGVNLTDNYLNTDFFGRPRRYGSYTDNGPVEYAPTTDVLVKQSVRKSLSCFPNPATDSNFTIRFTLPSTEECVIRVEDNQGRIVSVLANKVFLAGNQEIISDISSLRTGIYYLRLISKSTQELVSFVR